MSIIPADATELANLLRRTPAGEWPDIDDLAAQIGDRDRAIKIFDQAENEVQRENEIDALRAVLGVNLNDALKLLQAAEGQIDRLASNPVYDVEYAESTTASDLRHMLAEASRAVRIAQVLQKQIES
jgi:hypothetical protein